MLTPLPQNKIESLFSDYLSNLSLSRKSLKNYRSDISHFTGWLILKVRSYGAMIQDLSEAIPFLNREMGQEYKDYLIENNVPPKTLNRRLSTLRHLGKFLLFSQILDFDFMQGLPNLNISKSPKDNMQDLLFGFERHLASEKVSKSTIKNYISDTRQFLDWLNINHKPINH